MKNKPINHPLLGGDIVDLNKPRPKKKEVKVKWK